MSTGPIPAYVLCIPIEVYPSDLRRPDFGISMDAKNLEKLKSHISSLGSISALKLMGDDDYDNREDVFFMEDLDLLEVLFTCLDRERMLYLD